MSKDIATEISLDKFDGGRSTKASGWLAVAAVALTATVFCTTEFLPVGILRYISEDLDVSEGAAGLMVTAPGLLAAFAAPIVTVAVGKFDRRIVLWGLTLLLLASNIIAMVSTSFPLLILGRLLFGIGLGGFWAIGAGLGGRFVPERQAGQATSVIFAGVSIGMLIGGPAGALLGDLFGWRSAFAAAAAISGAALLLQLVILPRIPAEISVRPRDVLGLLETRNGRIGLLAMLLVVCGQFATYTYVTPFLAQVSGFDGTSISSLLLGFTAVGLVGNFAGGAGASGNLKTTFLLAIAFVAIPLFLLPALGTSQAWTIALLAIWGFSYGAMPVALQMWMARSAPEIREGGMALFVANFQISIALGSYAGGIVVDHFGLFATMYAGAAVAAISGVVLATLAGRMPSNKA